MCARIPGIEAADHGDQARIRGPNAEHRARLSVARNQMGAYGLVKTVIATLVEQVEILIGEQRWRVRNGGDGSFRHFPRS